MMLRHLPNLISGARLLMAVPIAWLISQGEMAAAAMLFVLFAVSDVLDGALARRFGWQSRLGGILDPMADKLLVVLTALALWHLERLPGWFVALIFARDLSIAVGAAIYHRWIESLAAEPTVLSKSTTAVLTITLVAFMVRGEFLVSEQLCQFLLVVSTVLLACSGTHYVARYTRRALLHRRSADHSHE